MTPHHILCYSVANETITYNEVTVMQQETNDIVTEIINLEAILNLPKGTEHFVSDLHGAYDAFQHILRNASGSIRSKAHDLFDGRLTISDIKQLATLIMYPEEKLQLIQESFQDEADLNDWYRVTICRLIEYLEFAASKYTRSKVRKALPARFVYIIEELLYRSNIGGDKLDYYNAILQSLIALDQADDLITDLSYTIQRLVVDHLHVVGDIYDRDPYPDKIMEALLNYHSVDIQWGNHDMIWMGAFCGSKVCLANVIRICARYNNLSIIEDRYGINLRPLFNYAEKYYHDNPAFRPKGMIDDELEAAQVAKVQQAISLLQFKLEAAIIQRRPEFKMDHRLVLDRIDFTSHTIVCDGQPYPLSHFHAPTCDPADPTALTEEENQLLDKLIAAFQNSEKLQRHIDFLYQVGSMYLIYNGNLLFHGCIPLTDEGSFASLTLEGVRYSGRALLDRFEQYVRDSYRNLSVGDDYTTDVMWYLWTGPFSSLFGKDEMKTFERYYIEDSATHVEHKNNYYRAREDAHHVARMLSAFGLPAQDSHIINGHTPVKEIKGENPIKAGGKLIVIDGGFSHPYHRQTGINGYTLLYNSYGMLLVTHQKFNSKHDAVCFEEDVHTTTRIVDKVLVRKRVCDTTVGAHLKKQVAALKAQLQHAETNTPMQKPSL